MSEEKVRFRIGEPDAARRAQFFAEFVQAAGPIPTGAVYLSFSKVRASVLRRRLVEAFGVVLDPPVYQFHGYVEELSGQLPGKLERIDKHDRIAIIDGLLRSQATTRSWVGSAPGIAQLVRQISALAAGDLEALEVIRARQGEDPELRPNTVLDIHRAYKAFLEREALADDEMVTSRCYEGILTGAIKLPDPLQFWVEMDLETSPLQRSLLHLLLEQAQRSYILMEVPPEQDTMSGGEFPKDETALTADKLAQSLRRYFGPVAIDFTTPAKPANKPPRLRLCSSRDAEVAMVVREVHDLLAEGCRAEEIAVAAWNPENYMELFRNALESIGIGVTPVARHRHEERLAALEKCLTLVSLQSGSRELMELLDHPGLTDSERPLRWCRSWSWLGQQGLPQAWPEWPSYFSAHLGSNLPDGVPEILETCQVLSPAVPVSKTASEWVRWASRVFERTRKLVQAVGGSAQKARELEWPGLSRHARYYSDVQLSLQEFLYIVRTHTRIAAQEDLLSLTPRSPAEIQALSARQVFWLGLVEEDLPRSSSRARAHRANPPKGTWPGEEVDMVAQLRLAQLARLSDRLVCTAPSREGTRVLSPVRHLFQDDPDLIESMPALTRHLDGRPANIGRGVSGLRAESSPLLTQFDGVLAPEVSLPATVTVTPSSLDEQAVCGLRFFLRQLVNPPQDWKSEILDRGEQGRVVHNILHRFVAEGPQHSTGTREEWLASARERIAKIALEELKAIRGIAVWREVQWGRRFESELLSGLGEGRQPRGLLRRFLDQHWSLLQRNEVQSVEKIFGPAELGQIEVNGRRMRIEVEGRVDRVDLSRAGLQIWDYKPNHDAFLRLSKGFGFQLPTYVILVENETQHQVVFAGFWELNLEDGQRLRGVSRGADGLLEPVIAFYRKRALKLVELRLRRAFPITTLPRLQAGCPSCRFRSVCGYDSFKADAVIRSGRFLVAEKVFSGDRGPFARQG